MRKIGKSSGISEIGKITDYAISLDSTERLISLLHTSLRWTYCYQIEPFLRLAQEHSRLK